jgi:hypothetical protein
MEGKFLVVRLAVARLMQAGIYRWSKYRNVLLLSVTLIRAVSCVTGNQLFIKVTLQTRRCSAQEGILW